MSDHPTAEELDGFICGELSPRKTRIVVAHLVRGCSSCSAALAGRQGALFSWSPVRRASERELDAAYDAALDRAMVAVGLTPLGHDEASSARSEQVDACMALLERCRELRLEAPSQLMATAQRAVEAANRLLAAPPPAAVFRRPGLGTPADIGEADPATLAADLGALAWAELANAHRAANDLRGAETAMARAFELCVAGSGDDLVVAAVFDLHASLLGNQSRFEEAFRLLDTAHDVYLRHGDRHNAGRALINKGVLTGASNDAEEAIRLLRRGLEMIDERQDPQLALVAAHNTAVFLVDSGHFAEAQTLLTENRTRYRRASASLRWRRVALSGLIAAGLGNFERAGRQLLEVKQNYDAAGLGFYSAQTALELAGVYLRQGRSEEARELAEEALRTFTDLGVGREILGALLLLRNSFEMDAAEALLERVVRLVRQDAN